MGAGLMHSSPRQVNRLIQNNNPSSHPDQFEGPAGSNIAASDLFSSIMGQAHGWRTDSACNRTKLGVQRATGEQGVGRFGHILPGAGTEWLERA